ncbi:MAG: endonuclease domain-containing protein [Leptospiraceae bacterium]|nr:endonuclease domain-containing protein [Leptospiraceae bacterium]
MNSPGKKEDSLIQSVLQSTERDSLDLSPPRSSEGAPLTPTLSPFQKRGRGQGEGDLPKEGGGDNNPSDPLFPKVESQLEHPPLPLGEDQGEGTAHLYKTKNRRNPTPMERILWSELRNRKTLNLKFRRQHVILNYIVDFYCAELKLVIEVDGEYHKYQKKYDNKRQKEIEALGYRVIRFTNKELTNDINILFQKLEELKNELPKKK